MKFTIQLALLLFVFLGVTTAAYSDPQPYNVNSGWSSNTACNAAYQEAGCDGVRALFEEHPIPIGAIDEETGREIVGFEIICDEAVLMSVGETQTAPGDNRTVPRSFGWIRLHYAPQKK